MSVIDKYFNPKALELAVHRVNCWSDRSVKDIVGLRSFKQNLKVNAEKLSQKIESGNYTPQRGFKFYVPKASKTLRTKTLLYVEDAIIYQAIINKVAENYYDDMVENSDFVFGSVLSPEVAKGEQILKEEEPNYFFFRYWQGLYRKFVESVAQNIEKDKVQFKFETDITGFFDSIPHYNLLLKLSTNFDVEDKILDMLSDCLETWSGTKDSTTPGVGIPQGPAPSFFLANLLLHDLDAALISHGFKYYRYMDDIKIFGYEEEELLDALLFIDKYTKGNALSINTKKTGVELIGENRKEEVKKEVKRVQSFLIYEHDLDDLIKAEEEDIEENASPVKKELDKDIISLSEQDASLSSNFSQKPVKLLKEEDEILEFWEGSLDEVREELPKLFTNSKETYRSLKLKKGVNDIDFIRLSAQYGSALYALSTLKEDLKADSDLLHYWIFAVKKFFWRTNYFSKTLAHYQNNEILKEALTELMDTSFRRYEWVRYHLVQTLSLTQSFTDKELRQVYYPMLKEEDSVLAKISLYRLCFKHSINRQFYTALSKQLKTEGSEYLKLLMVDFNRNHAEDDFNPIEFLEEIGL